MATSIEMFAGDTKNVVVTVKDEAGVVVNLTGLLSAKLQAVEAPSGRPKLNTTPKILKSIGNGADITYVSVGKIIFNIVPQDTRTLKGKYYYEIEIQDAQNNILTVSSGNLTIKESIIS